MCGRYLFDPMTGELDEYWQIIADVAKKQEKYKEREIATGEVFPSNNVLTLGANKNNEVVPGITKWGFEGFKKGQLFINARSESVEEKKTFSKHFRERRIVFPMNGFYEWNSDKKKFLFTGNNEVIYVAGFYRMHENVAESIIMTTEPNAVVSPIHDRMPLIVNKNDIDKWILDIDFAREYIKQDMNEFENMKVKSA